DALGRYGCAYSGYCGSYGCNTGAKGSARAALLDRAVATGRCEIRPHSFVERLESDRRGRVVAVHYRDREGRRRRLDARRYVVACQAIETCRLLLLSRGPRHPDGLGNRSGQVGRNLLFSAGGIGGGVIRYDRLSPSDAEALAEVGPFVNRGLQQWYEIEEPDLGGRVKGGTIDFLFDHPNPIRRALREKWDGGRLVWGSELKRRIHTAFTEGRGFRFEVFCDWLPTDDCRVTLDPRVRDRWGVPVARVRVGHHPHDVRLGRWLAARAEAVLRALGAERVASSTTGDPPPNLQAGGCRFGTDPAQSVLDPDCRLHDAPEVYVTDGSFMPTGGSVPYTWTIYANAFRVADRLVADLGHPT
ncbi:MAG: GMC family oxidoreductase, partial [Nitrospirae bacterium]